MFPPHLNRNPGGAAGIRSHCSAKRVFIMTREAFLQAFLWIDLCPRPLKFYEIETKNEPLLRKEKQRAPVESGCPSTGKLRAQGVGGPRLGKSKRQVMN